MTNNKMKILISPPTLDLNDIHNYHTGHGGAIGNISYNLFRSLTNFDMEIHAVVKSANLTTFSHPNLKLYSTGGDTFERVFGNFKQTTKILKKEKISLITQLYFFYNVSFNPMLKTVKDYPFVIGMCELPHKRYNDELSKTEKIIGKAGKKLLHPLFLKTLNTCDALIAVNEPTKDLYGKLIPQRKIKVIPYGVDMDRFKFTPLQENNHNILVVSRLIKRRKLNILIDAMPYILNEYPDTKLHIVGEGPEEKNFKTNYGILRRVFFHGNVNEQKLINLFKRCYVYCSPSEEDGWNQSILEAMSTGRPVICADVSHNSMVSSKTGLKMQYNDCIEYATTIKRLFGDFEIAQKLGEEGRREVEANHNWSDIGKKYYEVFKKVI